MSLSVIFLGTAGGVPTPKRSLPAVVVQRENEIMVFDCGEGLQRQFIKAGVSFHRKTKVFITHMHGDHVLGLPGLLQTMSLMNREKKLQIYGPPGIEAFVTAMQETVQSVFTFPVHVKEVKRTGTVCERRDYEVKAIWLDHSISTLAYALVEKPRPGKFYPEKARSLGVPEGPLWSKLQHGSPVVLPDNQVVKPEDVLGPPRRGRKIVYTGDTRPTKDLGKFAKDADLLIHESTLDDELFERAQEEGHSTPSGAARTAKKAEVKRLVLTHVSARYKDATILLEQAKKIFPETEIAEDFMKIELPLLNVK